MMTPEQIDLANRLCKGNMLEALGIEFIPSEPGTFVATMPVEPRTHQPMGILHGGATAALAETVGSMGSHLLVSGNGQAAVGIEVNANHLRSARTGIVKATGRLVHQGKSMHVWDIQVANEQKDLVAVCRLTIMIIDKRA
jgi:1,4-dihydroxy-2-naphthoyl-CoA hydrolase